MIRIKPDPENLFQCPRCAQKPLVGEILLQPVFALAECRCASCNLEFYQSLPLGHTSIDSLTLDKNSGKLLPGAPTSWLTESLLKAVENETKDEVRIEKKVNVACTNVIILNTLDFLYGHVLLKLYNSIYHLDHHKDLGLILVIPKSFEWLVPAGTAEVWTVDLGLSELERFYPSIQSFARKEFERFETVYFSKAYSHPDFTYIDISRFTGVRPFDLGRFEAMNPVITFVLREDRWWFRAWIDQALYRLCRKLGILKMGIALLSRRQNALVRETMGLIREGLPTAVFYLTGLGHTGTFSGLCIDERKSHIDESVERNWCRIYARSQVVIGVHGSNMLLPTAHAAGCVEILPEDRYGNMVQDLSVRYADRKQLYFYRFVEQYANPIAVARKAISMVKHFEFFNKNMFTPGYRTQQESVKSSALSKDDIYAIRR